MKDIKQRPAPPNTCHPKIYYPVFLNLEGKKAVVIGGGKVAERKILGLLKAGADVTVISPDITPGIAKVKKRLKYISRVYKKGDLKNAFIVIAATDSRPLNEKVSRESPCLANVVDTPDLCNFIVPSALRRGPLTIAVSTGGISPALSRTIRKEIERLYGSGFSSYLESLRKVRSEAMIKIGDKKERETFLKAIASDEMIGMLREKGFKAAKKYLQRIYSKRPAFLSL